MKQGLHYPILLNAPTKVPITYDQFNHLSYIGLASFFCNYKIVFGKKDGICTMYMMEGYERPFYNGRRFADLKKCWKMQPSAELVYCQIPMSHPLVKTIDKFFSHLIME